MIDYDGGINEMLLEITADDMIVNTVTVSVALPFQLADTPT
jgi:hypothetical protein